MAEFEKPDEARYKRLLDHARIPPRFRGKGQLARVPGIEEFVRELNGNLRRARGLLLIGSDGTGKTTTGVEILKAAFTFFHKVLYVTAPDLVSFTQERKLFDVEYQITMDTAFKDRDLLLIDDLGTEPSEARQMIANLIRHRVNYRRATILVTSLQEEDLYREYDHALLRLVGRPCIFVPTPALESPAAGDSDSTGAPAPKPRIDSAPVENSHVNRKEPDLAERKTTSGLPSNVMSDAYPGHDTAASASAATTKAAKPDLERLIEGEKSVRIATAARYMQRSTGHVERLIRDGVLERIGKGRPTQVSTASLRKWKGTQE